MRATIENFLELIDFRIVKTNTHCRLIDLQGANLGNIESEIFLIDDYLFCNLMDRLWIYIKDYFLEDFEEITDIDTTDFSYEELYRISKSIKDKQHRNFYRRLFKVLSNPDEYFYFESDYI